VIQKGKKAVNEIEFEIVKYENLHRKVQRARNMWTILSAKIDQSDSFREYASELDEVRDLLRTDFEETNSATICYFYLLIETEANQNERNYLVADLNLKKMHNLIMENSSLYTKARRGEVLVNIANNEIFLNNYSSAIKNAENAKLYFEKGTGNADVASEIEFFARFYNNELDLAEKIIEEIYISARKRNSPFAYGKRAYLYACIMTIKGEIEKSNELLGEVREIEKNKGGWNIAMRVLTIINCIEAKDYESADLKVMNMEKFIKRNSKLHHIRKRDVLILRILLKLINEGFDFKKVYKARKHYFELLEGKQPDYYWKIRSPELIIFHEWFKKKIKP
ncbi:MAG: hypothetical protein ABI763_16220, partial [Bacteroidota bacterium]